MYFFSFFFFQAEDGIRDYKVTGVQTCALPICITHSTRPSERWSGGRRFSGPGFGGIHLRDGVTADARPATIFTDRKSTRLNSSHLVISYAVFCLKKKKKNSNS